MSRVAAYNAEDSSWIELSVKGDIPGARAHHTAVLLGDKIILFGGMVVNRGGEPALELRILDTVSWRWLSPSEYLIDDVAGPPHLDSHGTVAMGSKMYVVAGSSPNRVVDWCGHCEYTNDVYAFEEDGEIPGGLPAYSWSNLDSPSLERLPVRKGHSVVGRPLADQLIVFGGMGYNTQRPTPFQGDVEFYQDIWAFNVNSYIWTEIKPASKSAPLPPRRMGHAAQIL